MKVHQVAPVGSDRIAIHLGDAGEEFFALISADGQFRADPAPGNQFPSAGEGKMLSSPADIALVMVVEIASLINPRVRIQISNLKPVIDGLRRHCASKSPRYECRKAADGMLAEWLAEVRP